MAKTTRVHASEDHDIYIGRPGPFGNPYRVGVHGTRAEVIAKHRALLERKIARNPAYVAKIVWLMEGKRLGCPGCKTGTPCHGDNYVAIVKKYRKLYKQK